MSTSVSSESESAMVRDLRPAATSAQPSTRPIATAVSTADIEYDSSLRNCASARLPG